MEKKTLIHIVLIEVVIVIAVGGLWMSYRSDAPRREAYTNLVECLKEKEAVFYGAFWCPRCAQQKNLFGSSAKKLPYVECSTPDGRDQTQQCGDEGITSYPTWEFKDGVRCAGMMPGAILAHLSECALPEYAGVTYTVEEVYRELVEDRLRESLSLQGESEEKVAETLESTRGQVEAVLQLWYQETLESADLNHVLEVIAKMVYQCGAKPEPETVEIEVEEEVDI